MFENRLLPRTYTRPGTSPFRTLQPGQDQVAMPVGPEPPTQTTPGAPKIVPSIGGTTLTPLQPTPQDDGMLRWEPWIDDRARLNPFPGTQEDVVNRRLPFEQGLYNPIPPAIGSGGPERWDTLRRDTFSGDNIKYTTTMLPSNVTAEQVMAERPEAVAAMRDKLEAKMKTVSAHDRARSPFWKEYSEKGQGFVAQLISDVVGRLDRARRFQQNIGQMRQLTPAQITWVRNHPLGMWLDWF